MPLAHTVRSGNDSPGPSNLRERLNVIWGVLGDCHGYVDAVSAAMDTGSIERVGAAVAGPMGIDGLVENISKSVNDLREHLNNLSSRF
jgi:hypothetical protein